MRAAPRRLIDRLVFLGLGLALGYLVAAHPTWASLQQPSTTPIAWVAPEGVVQISPCVPTMGEHWANPANLPMGPIYTVHNA